MKLKPKPGPTLARPRKPAYKNAVTTEWIESPVIEPSASTIQNAIEETVLSVKETAPIEVCNLLAAKCQ